MRQSEEKDLWSQEYAGVETPYSHLARCLLFLTVKYEVCLEFQGLEISTLLTVLNIYVSSSSLSAKLIIYLFVLLESVFMGWLKIVLVPAKHLDCALIGRPPAVASDPKFILDKSTVCREGRAFASGSKHSFFFFFVCRPCHGS